MLVNGEEFKRYELDTYESIINRVASKMKTLPKFLVVEGNIESLNVIDLLKLIKKDGKTNTNFEIFYNTLPDMKLDKQEIFHVWISYNKTIQDIKNISSTALQEVLLPFVQQQLFP